MAQQINIKSLSLPELTQHITEMGEKPFRAKQIYRWLWQQHATNFQQMTDVPELLREKLRQTFQLNFLQVGDVQNSNDGTIKSAFITFDGKVIEGVLIPTPKRLTACISSQIGCSLTCAFCATGKLKRLRNLTAAEIVEQVVLINQQALKYYQKPLTNIVYMGMGEPLLNYREVITSANIITSPQGLNMAAKRITVSTAGIAKMIEKLADDEVKFNLALSLHAANDEKRSKIMPINDQNNLSVLSKALKYFINKTGKKVTFEYIIFKDFNDGISDAQELVKFCAHIPSKVNIIEYNPIDGESFEKALPAKVDAFCAFLENKGITAKVRRSRGKDIDAACGQLANKNKAAFA